MATVKAVVEAAASRIVRIDLQIISMGFTSLLKRETVKVESDPSAEN